MNHEALPNPQSQETLPKPEYAAIEASIEALEQEANLAWEAMNNAYETAPDEARQSIDKFQEDFETATTQAVDNGEAQPTLSSFLETAEGLPDEYKTGAFGYESVVTKIESAETELEKYVPENALKVAEKAKKLEASLDYDKVVAEAFADDDRTEPSQEGVRLSSINLLYDVSKMIAVRKQLDSPTSLDYNRLKSLEHSLAEYEQNWQERGLLREEADKSFEVSDITLTTEQITDIEAHINDVYSVRTKYKKFDNTIRTKTQSVLALTSQIKESEEAPQNLDDIYMRSGVVYNEQLGTALNKRLTDKLNELPADEFEADIDSKGYAKLVEQARNIDVAEALKSIEVSGSFENLPFEYSEAELKLFLLTSVPETALASVKRIQFRPMTKEEDEEDTTLGLYKWSDELNGSEIIISDAKVKERYEHIQELMGDHENGEAMATLNAKSRMLRTITHEFGHALHEVLPVAALKRWEEQRATDPTNVTAYVKDRHDSNHHHRYMEDFADTMALFINQPEELIITSPVRFNAMRQIFEEYMPVYTDVTQKLQEHRITSDRMIRTNKGLSDEDVKTTYLSHETLYA